ncbi:IclR family transcriptional regulator domain-containing protein, partial [Burkholderia cenocepacia]
ELSRAASLPRPTVYRVLETLMQAGYVVRDEVTDVYSLTEKVTALSCGYGRSAHVIELAKPLVKEFSEEICWPSYLHVREEGEMVTRAIFRSPRALTYPRIGKRHSLAGSAPGRAYLSSLPTEERQRWLVVPGAAARDATAQQWDLNQMNSLIRDAALLGCGFREGGIVPRTCSISVPIRNGNDAAVYWTIVMMSSVLTVNKAISNYLAGAQAVVEKVERMVRSTDRQLAPELH